MIHSILPNSIELILALAKETERIDTVFEKNSAPFEQLKKGIMAQDDYDSVPEIVESNQSVTYLQLLLLLGLSMAEGVLIPVIKQLHYKDQKLKVVWDTGIRDEFTFGNYDDKFINFVSTFQKRILSRTQRSKKLNLNSVKDIMTLIRTYTNTLDSTEKRINLILDDPNNLSQMLDKGMNPDLLFTLLASFPADQINALLLFIQQFFPKELTVKTPDGNPVNIVSLFQTPSSDLKFLIEKIHLYFDLYYKKSSPIIKEITRSKTKDFILDLMRSSHLKEVALTNLQNIKENQILVRLKLYYLFSTHLEKVLK
jgi:hypothetical protein